MSFSAISAWESLTGRLRGIGQLLPPLILRLIMAWEFWESGLEKYSGENWFTDI
jgi:putative oxidoreductase